MDEFAELQELLVEIKDAAEELNGENDIPFDKLFTQSFMESRTDFESFDELLEESQWEVESREDFLTNPDEKFDKYIAEHTIFNNWEQMFGKATEKWTLKRLGF